MTVETKVIETDHGYRALAIVAVLAVAIVCVVVGAFIGVTWWR